MSAVLITNVCFSTLKHNIENGLNTLKNFIERLAELLEFNHLTSGTKAYLKKIYSLLGLSLLSAGYGAYISIGTDISLYPGFALSICLLFAVLIIPPFNRALMLTPALRVFVSILLAFGIGVLVNPVVSDILDSNPNLLPEVLLGTAMGCVSVTIFALSNPLLMTCIVAILVIDVIVSHMLLFKLPSYGGLWVGLVMYPLYTPFTLQAYQGGGSQDYVMDGINLFLFIANFISQILVMLT